MKKLCLVLSVIICVITLSSCTAIIPSLEEMRENLKDEDYIVTPITELTDDDVYSLFGVRPDSDARYFEAIDENSERVVVFRFNDTPAAEAFLDEAREELSDSFRVFARQGARVVFATSKSAYEDAIDD